MRILFIIVLTTMAFIVGCYRQSQEDVGEFLHKIKQEKPGIIEASPELKSYKGVKYTAISFRSPFKPISFGVQTGTGAVVQQKPRPDANREKELLENYPLDSLKMVGTLKREDDIWGLILDNMGIIHRVGIGNYLGKNSGCIENITDDIIYLKELVADGKGGWVTRAASLRL